MTKRLIIDCDPGIDDAFALYYLSRQKDVEVLGITTVFGNNTLAQTTENALRISSLSGLSCPIYPGASHAILNQNPSIVEFHGSNGVGNVELPETGKKQEGEKAWDAIARLVKAYPDVQILTLGPVTNLAIALLKYPGLKDEIHSVFMMGGSATFGNEGPYGEANVFADPYAMKVLLQAKVPLTMVGLNATEETRFSERDMEDVFLSEPSYPKWLLDMIDHYKRTQSKYGDDKLVIHDLAAVVVALNSEIAKISRETVDVEVREGESFGRTVVDLRYYLNYEKNVDVCWHIDHAKYLEKLKAIK